MHYVEGKYVIAWVNYFNIPLGVKNAHYSYTVSHIKPNILGETPK